MTLSTLSHLDKGRTTKNIGLIFEPTGDIACSPTKPQCHRSLYAFRGDAEEIYTYMFAVEQRIHSQPFPVQVLSL